MFVGGYYYFIIGLVIIDLRYVWLSLAEIDLTGLTQFLGLVWGLRVKSALVALKQGPNSGTTNPNVVLFKPIYEPTFGFGLDPRVQIWVKLFPIAAADILSHTNITTPNNHTNPTT